MEHGDTDLCIAYFRRFSLPFETRVLDVGTRFGSFVNALDAEGYGCAEGIDVDDEALGVGRGRYPHLAERLLLCDGESLSYPSAGFDVVTAFDVLEHIPDVEAYLREISRVLAANGTLIFQTPNRYINIPWEIIQHKSLTKWRDFHCSLQSLRSLRTLLEQAGFDGICIEKFNEPSEFKDRHASKKLGPIGPLAIRVARQMPLPLYPNFWGYATKATNA